MLRKLFYLLLLISFSGLRAQEFSTHYKIKKIVASKNGVQLDSVSLNSSFFKLENNKGKAIDSSFYKIDYQKSLLTFSPDLLNNKDTLIVRFLKFPDFLTKEYSIYDRSRVVSNDATLGDLYKVNFANKKKICPF